MKEFENINQFKKFLLSKGVKKRTIRIEDCELPSFEFIGEEVFLILHKNSKIIHFLTETNIYFNSPNIKNYTVDSIGTQFYNKNYVRPDYYPNKNQIGHSIYLKRNLINKKRNLNDTTY